MTFPEYLKEKGWTAYRFFTEHGLSRMPVYRAANSQPVEYQTAKRISEATGNSVTIAELME